MSSVGSSSASSLGPSRAHCSAARPRVDACPTSSSASSVGCSADGSRARWASPRPRGSSPRSSSRCSGHWSSGSSSTRWPSRARRSVALPGGGGYHRPMTDSPPADAPSTDAAQAHRPYSPGLEGVIAGETALSYVDGANGRLLYRGYRIGDLVAHGTYPAVANLLWSDAWDPTHRLPTAPIPPAAMTVLRALPASTKPMDALRTAVSAWGATRDLPWPPTIEHARALTAFSPS